MTTSDAGGESVATSGAGGGSVTKIDDGGGGMNPLCKGLKIIKGKRCQGMRFETTDVTAISSQSFLFNFQKVS